MEQMGSDFRERDEDKCSFDYAGMGHDELGSVHNLIIIEKQVDVNRSGGV